jgi:hypothetical protein
MNPNQISLTHFIIMIFSWQNWNTIYKHDQNNECLLYFYTCYSYGRERESLVKKQAKLRSVWCINSGCQHLLQIPIKALGFPTAGFSGMKPLWLVKDCYIYVAFIVLFMTNLLAQNAWIEI